jgi:hypothetical protein
MLGKLQHRDEVLKVSVEKYDVVLASWEVNLQGMRKSGALASRLWVETKA